MKQKYYLNLLDVWKKSYNIFFPGTERYAELVTLGCDVRSLHEKRF